MGPSSLTFTQIEGVRIAEVDGDGVAVSEAQDALEIVGNASYEGATGVLLHARQLAPEFFELRSRLAGDVLQKFINYHVRLAVVGDFEAVGSDSLRAFIYESNQGRHVAFVPDRESALAWLSGG